jgi:hypothetical protein
MNYRPFLLFTISVCCACSPRRTAVSNQQAQKNNRQIQQASSSSVLSYTPFTSLQYIARYKTIAIQEMNLYGVPASITLAQGLFESGSGNSDLARFANNHFGIKCTSEWSGKSYYKDDDQKNECFRVYDKPEDSFRDHSLFLKRKYYARLFELDRRDYKGWALGLKKAGYATNPNYPALLINIIEKYNLGQYDAAAVQTQNIKQTIQVFTQPAKNMDEAQKDTLQNAPADKFYTVKQGDTLYNISKRFGLTVDDLKAMNNLADNTIKIGQKLAVVK